MTRAILAALFLLSTVGVGLAALMGIMGGWR